MSLFEDLFFHVICYFVICYYSDSKTCFKQRTLELLYIIAQLLLTFYFLLDLNDNRAHMHDVQYLEHYQGTKQAGSLQIRKVKASPLDDN